MLKKLLSYLPSPLPVGVAEFEAWSDSIIALSGEFASRDSLKQALCNMIIHASPLKGTDTPRSHIPKAFFVKGLRKGAANQVASYLFQEIRTRQLEAVAAAEKAAAELAADHTLQVEATAGIEPANAQQG